MGGDRKSRPATRVPDPLTARRVKWRDEPDEDALTAAHRFLTLLFDEDTVVITVASLRDQRDTLHRLPLDLLRAANLPLLGRDDPHVTAELVRVADGRKLSPALVLRGKAYRAPIIAEGYARICASYHCDPSADVHLKMV